MEPRLVWKGWFKLISEVVSVKSVSLDHGVSQAMPEFFSLAIESGAAADHGPELPSELAAQVAEGPPAAQEVLVCRCGVARGKILADAGVFHIAFNLLLERFNHARNSHQHGNAFPANRRHDLRWD